MARGARMSTRSSGQSAKPRRSQRLSTSGGTDPAKGRVKLLELEDRPKKAKPAARTKSDASRAPSVARSAGKKGPAVPDADASAQEAAAVRREFERETNKLREQLRQSENAMAAREAALEKRQAALSEFVDTQVSSAAGAILQQLEEHFSCPLCLDVMASPTMLSAYACGHTFCGLCLAKWAFSLLNECGAWHDPIHCPFCRAPAIHTPAHEGRARASCPFLPNRTAANIVEELVAKLNAIAKAASPVAESAGAGSKKRKRVKSEPEDVQLPTELADWADKGQKRRDWLQRNKTGRNEISYVSKHWDTLTNDQFLEVKQRLKLLEGQ